MGHARAIITGTLALLAGAAHAGVIEVDAFHTGGFYGLDDMSMPIAAPDKAPTLQNYSMGRTTV